jgi:2,4-dienoyl-CoA reductase-like NADH-dependent reductase (Old Yellow Enzyme family)
MILRKIENYLKRTGMAATSFGRAVARDPRLVHDMRRGRVPGPRMTRRIAAFIGEKA